MQFKGKKLIAVLLIQIIILGISGMQIMKEIQSPQHVDVLLEDWFSELASYEDGWYIDEEISGIDQKTDFIFGPYIELPKGSYLMTVEYACDEMQTCLLYAGEDSERILQSSLSRLYPDCTTAEIPFTLTEDVSEFEIIFQYNAKGCFKINDISIRTTAQNAIKEFVLLTALFILVDMLLCFNISKDKWKLILALSGIVALSSMPLLKPGLVHGHDVRFHALRLESIYEEIRLGNLPVKMNSLYMNGYGYPISVYYGDILMYLPALLRFVGFSIIECYKFFVIEVNILTVLLAYFCFEKIFKVKGIALLTCLVYSTSSYRLLDGYTRAAAGEYAAMAFLPLLALAVYNIYTTDEKEWKTYKKNATYLAVAMAGLITTHVLTTEMVVVVLMLLCIVLCKKTLRKNTLRVFCLAIFQTVLLSLFFVVPFIDYYLTMHVNINQTVSQGGLPIGVYGAPVGSYIDIPGLLGSALSLNNSKSPGLILLLAWFVGFVTMPFRKDGKKIGLMLLFSALMIFVSSNRFPWDAFVERSGVGRWLSQVQFPWRYMTLAVIFLSLLFGLLLNGNIFSSLKWRTVISIFVVAMCVVTVRNYTASVDYLGLTHYPYQRAQLELDHVVGGEYLKQGVSSSSLEYDIIMENVKKAEVASRQGSRMELYCETGRGAGTLEVPIWNYKGYRVFDEHGQTYPIADGTNGRIRFELPAEFSGKVTVDFVQPWYWYASYLVSVLTVIVWIVQNRRKKA